MKLETRNCFDIVVNDEDAVYPITIDPLSSVPSWEGQINRANANFGWSVATAGDVNGDRYSDVIVGAPNHSSNAGVSFVFYGAANGISTTINRSFINSQAGAPHGEDVSSTGDVNGDDYSDVIISESRYNNGAFFVGRARIFQGSSPGLPTNPNQSIVGNAGNNNSYGVSSAGDVSGDVSQDGVIDATDAGAIDNDAYNFVVGYVATDLTGDEVVDATDADIADNNAFNFVAKATP